MTAADNNKYTINFISYFIKVRVEVNYHYIYSDYFLFIIILLLFPQHYRLIITENCLLWCSVYFSICVNINPIYLYFLISSCTDTCCNMANNFFLGVILFLSLTFENTISRHESTNLDAAIIVPEKIQPLWSPENHSQIPPVCHFILQPSYLLSYLLWPATRIILFILYSVHCLSGLW